MRLGEFIVHAKHKWVSKYDFLALFQKSSGWAGCQETRQHRWRRWTYRGGKRSEAVSHYHGYEQGCRNGFYSSKGGHNEKPLLHCVSTTLYKVLASKIVLSDRIIKFWAHCLKGFGMGICLVYNLVTGWLNEHAHQVIKVLPHKTCL